jgi:hypothetical protein
MDRSSVYFEDAALKVPKLLTGASGVPVADKVSETVDFICKLLHRRFRNHATSALREGVLGIIERRQQFGARSLPFFP